METVVMFWGPNIRWMNIDPPCNKHHIFLLLGFHLSPQALRLPAKRLAKEVSWAGKQYQVAPVTINTTIFQTWDNCTQSRQDRVCCQFKQSGSDCKCYINRDTTSNDRCHQHRKVNRKWWKCYQWLCSQSSQSGFSLTISAHIIREIMKLKFPTLLRTSCTQSGFNKKALKFAVFVCPITQIMFCKFVLRFQNTRVLMRN